jgi:peptidoglycan L-alanyl-D-glutamate endopeptidase CwlK
MIDFSKIVAFFRRRREVEHKFGQRSMQNLSGVHPDLIAVAKRASAISGQDFSVIEGVRNIERQRQLVAQGKSQTMNSRHLTGHAVDVVPYPVSWDWDKFYPIADAFIEAAKELDIPLRWGGNWRVDDIREWEGTGEELAKAYPGKFPDGPHFELSREYYP